MTGVEMKEWFVTELTQWRKKPRIDSKDIYYWLNSAQDSYIEDLFGDGKFNVNRKVTEYLRPLFVKDTAVATTYVGEITEGYYCDEAVIPTASLFIVSVRGATSLTSSPEQTPGSIRTGTDSQNKVIRIVQSDDVYRLLDDPFHSPKKRNAIGDVTEGDFHAYTDGTFVVTSIIFDYIKEPTAISDSGNSDLPDFVHNDIVTKAVSMFLDKELEVSQKHQSNSLEKLT